MDKFIGDTGPASRGIAASLAIVALAGSFAWPGHAAGQASPSTAKEPLVWNFDHAQPADGERWTAERGTMTLAVGEIRLQPDANRRVILLSPPGLPDAVRHAEEFVLGLSGTGLQRVRIQARRDPRGGWITIADANGSALREGSDGYTIKRHAGTREAPIERLRIELQFRTTNPRTLRRFVAVPGPG